MRLLDFFDFRTGWTRRLWNIGVTLTLEEALEAVAAVRAGVLSDDSLGFLMSQAHKTVGTDPGVGTPEERRSLQAALKPRIRLDGLEYHVIHRQTASVRRDYLRRWAAVLRNADHPRAERTARSIASHLLDIGYSSDFLHRWWKYHLHHEASIRPLADIVEQSETLASAAPSEFERNF
jgi:hypothetical protein